MSTSKFATLLRISLVAVCAASFPLEKDEPPAWLDDLSTFVSLLESLKGAVQW